VNDTVAAAGIGALTALLGAAIGGGLLVRAATINAKSTERQNADRLAHERDLATEERRQTRIERAYLHLLQVVNEVTLLIERDSVNNEDPGHDDAAETISEVWAELDAFGSDAVLAVFNRWRAARELFVIDMGNARTHPNLAADAHHMREVRDLRKEVMETASELRQQVARELRGER
jgi:hypothetical protein